MSENEYSYSVARNDDLNDVRTVGMLFNWEEEHQVHAYRDIHGLWIIANKRGEMIGHGATKIDALWNAYETHDIAYEIDEGKPNYDKLLASPHNEIKEGH